MIKTKQINKSGELIHLISTEGIPKSIVLEILDRTSNFLNFGEKITIQNSPVLKGKTVFNIFFESSTRTSTTFEIAAKRLSADVINFNVPNSSAAKGESLLDTVDNLISMQANMFVIRHSQSGASALIANHINLVAPGINILNAGDGSHAHPTQALLDMYTIRHFKQDFSYLSVAIIGDIVNSRVARSDIHALSTLGVPDIRVIAPKTLLPPEVSKFGVKSFVNIEEGLSGVDVVIVLRLQRERMNSPSLPSSEEYNKLYGLTKERLVKCSPDVIVLHPGPMNRGIEIDSLVADSSHAVILKQVTFGIAVRMAVMEILNRASL